MKKISILILIILLLTGCGSNKNEVTINGVNGNDNFTNIKYEFPQWNENYEINNDYLGNIKFQSGIVDEPFMKCTHNNQYLRTDWKTGNYKVDGTVFLDANADLNSNNMTLYGHYWYLSNLNPDNRKFTNLHKLTKQENYEENKYIDIYLKDEMRTYVVSNVFIIDLEGIDGKWYAPENLHYYEPQMTDDYFDIYYSKVKELSLYDTGVELTNEDKTLTLQTCVRNMPSQRLIVIAKQIS